MKPYLDVNERTKRHRQLILRKVLDALRISLFEFYTWAIKQTEVKEALNADLRTTGSILQKTLKRTRIGIPISPDHLASLYITKNSSELDVQFDNSYLSFGLLLNLF